MTKPSEAPSARDKGCGRVAAAVEEGIQQYRTLCFTTCVQVDIYPERYSTVNILYALFDSNDMLFFLHVHPGQASPKGGGDTRKTLSPLQPSCVAACRLKSGDKVEAQNVSESMSQLPMEDVHTKARNFKAHTTLSRGNFTYE